MTHPVEIDAQLTGPVFMAVRANLEAAVYGIEHLSQRLRANGMRAHTEPMKLAWQAVAEAQRHFAEAMEADGKEGSKRAVETLEAQEKESL